MEDFPSKEAFGIVLRKISGNHFAKNPYLMTAVSGEQQGLVESLILSRGKMPAHHRWSLGKTSPLFLLQPEGSAGVERRTQILKFTAGTKCSCFFFGGEGGFFLLSSLGYKTKPGNNNEAYPAPPTFISVAVLYDLPLTKS